MARTGPTRDLNKPGRHMGRSNSAPLSRNQPAIPAALGGEAPPLRCKSRELRAASRPAGRPPPAGERRSPAGHACTLQVVGITVHQQWQTCSGGVMKCDALIWNSARKQQYMSKQTGKTVQHCQHCNLMHCMFMLYSCKWIEFCHRIAPPLQIRSDQIRSGLATHLPLCRERLRAHSRRGA